MDFVIRGDHRVALAEAVGRLDQKTGLYQQVQGFLHLGRSHRAAEALGNKFRNGTETAQGNHLKDYRMMPLPKDTELRLLHLVELGTRAALDQLFIVGALFFVGGSLVKENEIFEVGGTLFFQPDAVNELGDGSLGNVALAVNGQLQVRVTRKPRLLRKKAETEGRQGLLLELVVVPQVHPEIGVLQNIGFRQLYIFSIIHTI